jgi:hypothetical protein
VAKTRRPISGKLGSHHGYKAHGTEESIRLCGGDRIRVDQLAFRFPSVPSSRRCREECSATAGECRDDGVPRVGGRVVGFVNNRLRRAIAD